jgi:hypothetical protein
MTEPDIPPPMSEAELEYYYYGLYRMLRRYRTMTLLGWAVVAAGLASMVLGWRYGMPQGLIDILLSCLTITAGVAVVYQGVAALETYVRVPVLSLQGKSSESEAAGIVREILEIIREIDAGGWQEAYLAVRKLRDLGALHGLPPLPV